MTEGKNEAARVPVEHGMYRVARLKEGGFALNGGRMRYRAEAVGRGWRIEAGDDLDGWSLRRTGDQGFVLYGRDGTTEAARTMSLVGTGAESGLRFLLLDDGRLFRIALRGPRDWRYELLGWETPGAYLTARPETEGWILTPTAACGGLKDIRVLCLMLAAEVLDSDGTSGTREPW